LSKPKSVGTFAGELAQSSATAESTFSYVYNPENPTPNLGGTTLFFSGAKDNLPFLLQRQNIDKDVVIFTGAQLADDVVIAGYVEVILHVSSSLEHTDFYARLLDFDAEKNVSMNVCEGLLRITPEYRREKNEEDGSFKILIKLQPAFYSFAAKHRIMLQVASGAHPHWSRNPGTGVHISDATSFLSSNQKIFTGPKHESSIILPVLLEK